MGETREGFTGHLIGRESASALRQRKLAAPVGPDWGYHESYSPPCCDRRDGTLRGRRCLGTRQHLPQCQGVRLSVHFTLKQDCSAQPAPDIRVVTPPANGTLSVRVATARAPQAGQCRNIETPARVVFYQSHQGYTGPDQVVVELKKANGSTETQSVAITVEPAKRPAPQKPGTTEL